MTFFGREVQANSVAFVIDASQSMSGMRFQRARTELVNALSKLEPNQRFFVVFYTNETYPMFFPDNTIELIPADQRNLARVFNKVPVTCKASALANRHNGQWVTSGSRA